MRRHFVCGQPKSEVKDWGERERGKSQITSTMIGILKKYTTIGKILTIKSFTFYKKRKNENIFERKLNEFLQKKLTNEIIRLIYLIFQFHCTCRKSSNQNLLRKHG